MMLALVTAFVLYHRTTVLTTQLSAARVDDLVTATSIALVSHCKSARQVWDVSDTRGWAAQTFTTSSSMLMDCCARSAARYEHVEDRFVG